MRIKLFDDYRYNDTINMSDSNGKQGYWEHMYNNNTISSKGYFVDNKKEGYWESYYVNNKIKVKCNFNRGHISGYIETYYENGKLDFKNITDDYKNEEWLPLSDREYVKVMEVYNLLYTNIFANIFYLFNHTNDFIFKLEDDYYVICYKGIYTKYDQLNSLLIALKKIKNNDKVI